MFCSVSLWRFFFLLTGVYWKIYINYNENNYLLLIHLLNIWRRNYSTNMNLYFRAMRTFFSAKNHIFFRIVLYQFKYHMSNHHFMIFQPNRNAVSLYVFILLISNISFIWWRQKSSSFKKRMTKSNNVFNRFNINWI